MARKQKLCKLTPKFMQRETERDREIQRDTERDREIQRGTERYRVRQTETERDREAGAYIITGSAYNM